MGPLVTQKLIFTAVFSLFLLNGVLLTLYHHLRSQLYGFNVKVGMIVINEMGGAVAGAVFLGLFLYLFCRKPIQPDGWLGWAAIHIAAIAVYSALHTSAHLVIRTVFYPWFGYGPFDPKNIPLRYAMELPNDVVTYTKWLVLFILLQYYQRLRDRELTAAALEHSLADARLKNLQSQMQPHFLLNALNAISSLIYTNPRTADEMIARLGVFLRRLLSEDQSSKVSLAEEIESVQTYVDIMQMRYEDRLKYSYELDPSVSLAQVPPLSLQPLVENSILHGMDPVDFSVKIDVTARRFGDQVEVAVRDHGRGMQPGTQPGVGLRNLRSRMTTLYGERQTMQVEQAEGGGTIVRLLIPYNG